jgi:glycerol kinase
MAELDSLWCIDRVFDPSWDADQRESMLHTWRRAVARTRDWVQ